MPAIRRLSDAPYHWDIIEAPLSAVANKEKLLPPGSSGLMGSVLLRQPVTIWAR